MLSKKKPTISVVIPVKTINDYLKSENLPAFTKQTIKDFEVIVLPNNKSPNDRHLLKKYPWLRIIPTHTVTRPAQKRDIGVKNARGKIIAFIDDDAYPSPQWLEKALYFFNLTKAEAVCGPGLIPHKTNIWEKIFNEVFKTWVGSGGYSYRFQPEKERYIDDYPSMNFLVKKTVFEKIGGFNSEYWPGEDSKFCNDLVHTYNGKIFYHPDVYIYHHRRTKFDGYLKQHGSYGYHRGAFFAHGDTNSRRLSYVIPTLFVLYLVSCISYLVFILTTNYQLLATGLIFLPLGLYLLFELYLFTKALIYTQNIKVALGSIFILLATHLWYGTMFVKGFFTGLIKKEKIYN